MLIAILFEKANDGASRDGGRVRPGAVKGWARKVALFHAEEETYNFHCAGVEK